MLDETRLIKKILDFFFLVAFLGSKGECSFLSHTSFGVITIRMTILKSSTLLFAVP